MRRHHEVLRLRDQLLERQEAGDQDGVVSVLHRMAEVDPEHPTLASFVVLLYSERSAFDEASAQLAASRAAVRAAEQQLEQATEDLGDAVLNAPFSGRITAVHIAEGAVVSAGTPVVTLTLMDPVQVQVEVSADDERAIKTGDRAIIYPKDPLQGGQRVPINGIVFEKGAVADPQLRTFRIDLIVRLTRPAKVRYSGPALQTRSLGRSSPDPSGRRTTCCRGH